MIVHLDIDAFYASVAQRDTPTLRKKPIAIAGMSRRAVVLTASYEARAYGIRSAMPLYRARELCRELIVVPPDFTRYSEASKAVFAIFARGAAILESLSMDEAYVALATEELGEAVTYARTVRRTVREEVGLVVSAGVARQKLLAKIASDDAKPDGLRIVNPGFEAAYLREKPVGCLWGIGPKTQIRLTAAGITRIGELAELSDEAVFKLFGRQGHEVREMARGNDARQVRGDHEVRSVSSEITFENNVRSIEELQVYLNELCADVAKRLRSQGLRAQTIGIKLKNADFKIFGRQTTLAQPTDSIKMLQIATLHCLQRCDLHGEDIRLLGVRATSLAQGIAVQMSILLDENP